MDVTQSKIYIGDVEFRPFYDIGIIIGKKASGKSFLAKKIVSKSKRVIIWDSNREYGKEQGLTVIDDISKIKNFDFWNSHLRIAYHPVDCDYTEFQEFCSIVQEKTTFLLVVEEIGRLEASKRINNEFKTIVDSGRHQGIGVLSIGRRITDIPPFIRSSADLICSFTTLNEKDIYMIDALTGRSAQMELKEYFLGNPEKYKHYFLYYGGSEADTIIHRQLKI